MERAGVYSLDADMSGNVTISAQGADGTVLADAVKFVYLGNVGAVRPALDD